MICSFLLPGNRSKIIVYCIIILYNAIGSTVQAYAQGQSSFPSAVRTRTDPNSTNVISIAFGGYTDLLERSRVIVDKSLFLKVYLADSMKVQIVTYPNAWGKTIIAYMIKSFFEARCDSTGSLYKRERQREYKFFIRGNLSTPLKKIWYSFPPLIAKSANLISKYCRLHPVIVVDFSRVYPENHTESLYECFKNAIGQCFRQHSYLGGILKKKSSSVMYDPVLRKTAEHELKVYEEYSDPHRKSNPSDLQSCLQFLSHLLHGLYLQPVIMVINDYDSLIKRMYFEMNIPDEDREKFMNFFEKFLELSFEFDRNVMKVLILGELRMQFLHNYRSFHHPYPFFGFSKDEVLKLFYHRVPEDMWEEAFQWYGGYKLGFEHEPLFPSGSIARFLNAKKFDNFFENTHNSTFIKSLMKFKRLRKRLELLMFGHCARLEFVPEYAFNHNRMLFLRKIFKGDFNEPFTISDTETVLYFLKAQGFLSGKYSNMPNKRGSVHWLTIPNREVEITIIKKMCYHYFDVTGRDIAHHIRYVSGTLCTTIREDRDGSTAGELEMRFSHLFQCLNNETRNGTELLRNKEFLNDVILSMVLYTKLQNYCNLTKPDSANQLENGTYYSTSIFLSHEQNASMTELKFDFETQDGSLLVPTNITIGGNILISQFIGVHVNQTGAVKIRYDVKQIQREEIPIRNETRDYVTENPKRCDENHGNLDGEDIVSITTANPDQN